VQAPPPEPDPPFKPLNAEGVNPVGPPAPPADDIVEKLEADPQAPVFPGGDVLPAPPPPTAIGKPVAVTARPAGAFKGFGDPQIKLLKPPAPAPPVSAALEIGLSDEPPPPPRS
jgi:hypothetical protein